LLFLLPLDFFSPPWLLRLLLPLARSLCALLFCELALPPLLAASARLPLLRLDDDDDLELRGAIDISFGDVLRQAHHAPRHKADSRIDVQSFCRLCLRIRVGHTLYDALQRAQPWSARPVPQSTVLRPTRLELSNMRGHAVVRSELLAAFPLLHLAVVFRAQPARSALS
jgi:hypothetical protein